eukprot:GHRQ01035964.1.p1 GENE.GHRQ01035964.1~~GHRQ01035964.1.p1  ORF type:complete len:140 (+),score=25.43 GHRQ01035964.1:387-806(+)
MHVDLTLPYLHCEAVANITGLPTLSPADHQPSRCCCCLLAAADFIGLSSYAPLPANLTQASMETSIETAAFELLPFGIDLKELIFVKNKSISYSEQGLGGTTDNYRVPPNLTVVRSAPYAGSPPRYSAQLDPWKVSSAV